MTYNDDLEIIENTGRALGAAFVDVPVAATQDAINVFKAIRTNAVNNIASKEQWKEKFENFWSDAWEKEGGIKDMLIDSGLDLLKGTFFGGWEEDNGKVSFKYSGIDEEAVEWYRSLGWRDTEQKLYKDATGEELEEIEKVNFKIRKIVFLRSKFADTVEFKKRNTLYPKDIKEIIAWFNKNCWGIYNKRKGLKKPASPISKDIKVPRLSSNNKSINDIYKAGPLLYSNMFDVAFVLTNRDGSSKTVPETARNTILFLRCVNNLAKPLQTTKVEESLYKTSDFSVKCASVSIPMPVQRTFQTKFIETTVERPASTIEFTNSASLNIEMDANLYYLDMFQALAGHRPLKMYINELGELDACAILNQNAANLTGNDEYELSIVVTSRTLSQYSKYDFNPAEEGGNSSNMCFVFRDVIFTGGGKVEFNRTSSSTQQCEFEFIFKNIEYIYKSNTSDEIKSEDSKMSTLKYKKDISISTDGLVWSSVGV